MQLKATLMNALMKTNQIKPQIELYFKENRRN